MKRYCLTIGLCCWECLSLASFAEETSQANWPHWRGPSASGQAEASASPPIHWDSKKNMRWVTELAGEGSSTPIVWKDQIFVLSAEATQKKAEKPIVASETSKTVPPNVYYRFLITSVDRESGKVRWQKVATEQVPHEGRHPTHTYAAGSPTTDGQRLYASFGSRGIFAYSLQGEMLWQVDLGDMNTRYGWGEAVTPVLAGEKLIVNWDQEQGSFITALDKRTGKTIWRTERPKEVTSWNTPLVTDFEGKTLVVVNGTDRARAYDVESGQEIWSCGGQTVNAIPSPVRYADTAICISGYRTSAGFAIPLGSRGDVTESPHLRWKIDQGTPYVPSPLVSGKRLFFTAINTDVLTCLQVETGKPAAERKRLSGVKSLYASPIVAGGYIYYVGREGTTVVVQDNESLDTVAVNALDDAIDASPVAVGDRLFLRSWTKLYCIGN